jgi:hypothetical protein
VKTLCTIAVAPEQTLHTEKEVKKLQKKIKVFPKTANTHHNEISIKFTVVPRNNYTEQS